MSGMSWSSSAPTVALHIGPIPVLPPVGAYAASKAAALKMVEIFAARNPQFHVVNIQSGWVVAGANNF
ncbi:hypothetical protein B7463_g3390, partial [Scytalidium lignicola]